MDNLCHVCRSISWEEIPPFPEDIYNRIPSGYEHFHYIHRKPNIRTGEPLGTKHHESIENLRHAASQGCGLCGIIEHQVDALLLELGTLGQPRSRPYDNVHPQFDFWLTKRPDDVDGVWVLTNSTWQPGQWVMLVAAIAFYAEEDDSLAAVFNGRPVTEVPGERVLERVNTWVESCNQHPGCQSSDRTMPTRLIDVGPHDNKDTVKLVEAPGPKEDNYVALSYCWGKGQKDYITTKANIVQRKDRGFDMKILPRSVRDAIDLTRRLHVKYLWVDGICICQDDDADWGRESKTMGRVYGDAYLTISADGVDDSDGGLFFSRVPRKTLKLPFTAQDVTGTVVMSSLPLDKEYFKSFHVDMFKEPLTDRAWCFQERVLSRRIIHFTKDQTYFECLQGVQAEDGLTLPYRFTFTCKEAESMSELMKSPARNVGRTHSGWQDLLHRYGARKLTYGSDKLPALSGIAEIYQELLQDEYLAGLWKGSLLEGLSWTSPNSPQRPESTAADYRAPSWSWAAVDGFSWHGLKRPYSTMAEIHDTHVEAVGDNPFGRVKNAWITLSAPLVPLDLSNAEKSGDELVVHSAEGEKESMRIGLDNIDVKNEAAMDRVRNIKLYSLVLARVTPSHPNDMDYDFSLVITPVNDTTMKRIGYTTHRYTSELGEAKIITLV